MTHVVDEISDLMAKLERHPKLDPELKSQEVHELGKAASKCRDEISRELGR